MQLGHLCKTIIRLKKVVYAGRVIIPQAWYSSRPRWLVYIAIGFSMIGVVAASVLT
jgi:hypothetical protein